MQSEAQANGDWARLGGKFKEHWDFLSRYVTLFCTVYPLNLTSL